MDEKRYEPKLLRAEGAFVPAESGGRCRMCTIVDGAVIVEVAKAPESFAALVANVRSIFLVLEQRVIDQFSATTEHFPALRAHDSTLLLRCKIVHILFIMENFNLFDNFSLFIFIALDWQIF